MANPKNYPPKPAGLHDDQKISQDLFEHVRTNGDNSWDADVYWSRISARTQPVANLPQTYQLPHPGSQAARAIRQAGLRNRGTRLDDNTFSCAYTGGPSIDEDDEKFSRRILRDRRIRARMQTTGVAFVKQLGWVCILPAALMMHMDRAYLLFIRN